MNFNTRFMKQLNSIFFFIFFVLLEGSRSCMITQYIRISFDFNANTIAITKRRLHITHISYFAYLVRIDVAL